MKHQSTNCSSKLRALSIDNHGVPGRDTLIFILISNQDIYVSAKVISVLERMFQWKQFSQLEHREGKKQFIQIETAFIQRNWGTSQSTTFPRETPLVTISPFSIVLRNGGTVSNKTVLRCVGSGTWTGADVSQDDMKIKDILRGCCQKWEGRGCVLNHMDQISSFIVFS